MSLANSDLVTVSSMQAIYLALLIITESLLNITVSQRHVPHCKSVPRDITDSCLAHHLCFAHCQNTAAHHHCVPPHYHHVPRDMSLTLSLSPGTSPFHEMVITHVLLTVTALLLITTMYLHPATMSPETCPQRHVPHYEPVSRDITSYTPFTVTTALVITTFIAVLTITPVSQPSETGTQGQRQRDTHITSLSSTTD